MTTSEIANTRRAAELLMACLDDDPDTVTALLDAANNTPGGLPGLLSAMASGLLELLIATVGEDGTRKTLNMILLDTSLEPSND